MNTDGGETVLDHIDGIKVEGAVFAESANEYGMLRCLWHGMEALYGFAKRCDEAFLATAKPGIIFSNVPVPGVDIRLLTCSFHWYAISAYQYGLLIGHVAHQQDKTRPRPGKYVEQVMPEILAFRNKVAAHFALAKGDGRDNPAEQLASVMQFPMFSGGSYCVGATLIAIGNAGGHTTSEAIKQWSIVKMQERLRERYWPNS